MSKINLKTLIYAWLTLSNTPIIYSSHFNQDDFSLTSSLSSLLSRKKYAKENSLLA